MPRIIKAAGRNGNDGSWEIEEILQCKELKRTTRYLVKWKGYDESYNEWVDKKDLECPLLLREFQEKSNRKKPITALSRACGTMNNANKNSIGVRKHKRNREKQEYIAAITESSTKKRKIEINKENVARPKARPILNLSDSNSKETCLPISKALTKEELATLSFEYEYPFGLDEETTKQVRVKNRILVAEAGTVLAQLNFWRVLDEYNYAVRKPAVPGEEYLVKEFGPYLGAKAIYVEECCGCGADINKDDWYFWHPRESFLVDLHFCQPCVAFLLYSLQVMNLRPALPHDSVELFQKVLKLAYPEHFTQSKM